LGEFKQQSFPLRNHNYLDNYKDKVQSRNNMVRTEAMTTLQSGDILPLIKPKATHFENPKYIMNWKQEKPRKTFLDIQARLEIKDHKKSPDTYFKTLKKSEYVTGKQLLTQDMFSTKKSAIYQRNRDFIIDQVQKTHKGRPAPNQYDPSKVLKGYIHTNEDFSG
jgi:hypothetical protein